MLFSLLALALLVRSSAQTAGVVLLEGCAMRDEERRDSWDQVFALTAADCERRGFCWAQHDVPGIPWCYFKEGEGLVDAGECAAAASTVRRECAEKGTPTNEKTCAARQCCWAPGEPGQPWCFFPGAAGSTPKPKVVKRGGDKKQAQGRAKEQDDGRPATPLQSPPPRATPPPAEWRPHANVAAQRRSGEL
jgi:Trefoil (P-type) domain